jgi:hypothetical protein
MRWQWFASFKPCTALGVVMHSMHYNTKRYHVYRLVGIIEYNYRNTGAQ